MDQAKLPLIDGYRLNVSCIGSFLFIEAEEPATKRTFSLKLDGDSVAQITQGLFTDVQSMRQGLVDAIARSYAGVKLSIHPGGKLLYSANISLGALQKEYNFSLDLEEQKLEPLTFFERKVNFLTEENKQLKAEIAKIKIENNKSINELIQRVKQLEEKVFHGPNGVEKDLNPLADFEEEKEQLVEIYFNPNSRNDSSYYFSNNDKSIELIQKAGKHPCLECLPQIPQQGQYKYTLLIELRGSEEVVFGITPSTQFENWNHQGGTYWYWTKDGKIRGGGIRKALSCGPIIDNNSTVTMLVDMDSGVLTFMQNTTVLCSCQIAIDTKYNVYVSLGGLDDSVTLV